MFNHAFADMLDDDTSFRCVASVENIRELAEPGRQDRPSD
jgi:hypothetical protein